MIIVVLFAFLLRIYFAFSTDLWLDEVLSIKVAQETSWTNLLLSSGNYWDYVHPPFYFFLLKIWSVFSLEDDWLRSLNLIFFIPSAYLVFLIGKKLKDQYVGFLAILFFSLHPLSINLSFQLRPYSLAVFINLLVILFFLNSYQKNLVRKHIKVAAILAISIFIDYSSIWLFSSLIIYAIYLFFVKSQYFKNVLKIIFYTLVFAFYQFLVFFKAIFIIKNKPGGVYNDFNFILSELSQIFGFQFANYFNILLFCLIFLLIFIFIAKNYQSKKYIFLGIVLFSNLFLSLIFSFLLNPIFLARNLFVVAIAMIFISSLFFRNYFQKNIFIKLILLIIFLVLIRTTYQRKSFYYLTGLESFIKKEIKSGDQLVFLPLTWQEPVEYYLSQTLSMKNYSKLRISSKKDILAFSNFNNKRLVFFYGTDCLNSFSCKELKEDLEIYCINKNCLFKWI